MYKNPYERMKEIADNHKKNNSDFFSEEQMSPDLLSKDTFGIIQSINSVFNNPNNNSQFIGMITHHLSNSQNQIESALEYLPVVSINIQKVYLYGTPFLFIMKKIIKSMPNISLEDKKMLWDRTNLFFKALNKTEDLEPGDEGGFVIINELEFDDPIEYVRNEFQDLVRAYDIRMPINILFYNNESISYSKFKKLIFLIQSIFSNIKIFRFVFVVSEIHINNYILNRYGENNFSAMLEKELSIFSFLINKKPRTNNNKNTLNNYSNDFQERREYIKKIRDSGNPY